MKKSVFFATVLAIVGIVFASCQKEEIYKTPTNFGGSNDPFVPNKTSKVFYSYSSGLKNSQGQTGEVLDGDTLRFAVPGFVYFYTKPADMTCNWVFGHISHVGKDQISHEFSTTGTYSSNVVGDNTSARNFVVLIGDDNITPPDTSGGYTIPYNIILKKKESTTNNWKLTFHVRNQNVGAHISTYGHVGAGYLSAPGWTNPAFNNISFYSNEDQGVLVYVMNVAKNYVGAIKFNLTAGTNYFEANQDNLGGKFFNSNNPGDNVWQFNINGYNGVITSWDGSVISEETGQTGSPGKNGDDLVRFSVNNLSGGDEGLTIFVKSDANELRFYSDNTSSEGVPVGATMSVATLYDVNGYVGWKSTTIPRVAINPYLWFHFGKTVNGNYIRTSDCDNSLYFIQSQQAFRLMS